MNGISIDGNILSIGQTKRVELGVEELNNVLCYDEKGKIIHCCCKSICIPPPSNPKLGPTSPKRIVSPAFSSTSQINLGSYFNANLA